MSLWRLIPIQGGGEKRKGGESVQEKVIPLKGIVLRGVLRHPKKEYLKIFSSCLEQAHRTEQFQVPVYMDNCPDLHQTSEHRRLKWKCNMPCKDGICLGCCWDGWGIYRKDWRLRFMRLEPVTSSGFWGFSSPMSFPAQLYFWQHWFPHVLPLTLVSAFKGIHHWHRAELRH